MQYEHLNSVVIFISIFFLNEEQEKQKMLLKVICNSFQMLKYNIEFFMNAWTWSRLMLDLHTLYFLSPTFFPQVLARYISWGFFCTSNSKYTSTIKVSD